MKFERNQQLSRSAPLAPAELRSNRRALLALLVITILGAIAAGIALVGRIVDDDGARPNRSGASTLDGGRVTEPPDGGDDAGGAIVVTVVGLAAAGCVAAPFVIARRRRRNAAEPAPSPAPQ